LSKVSHEKIRSVVAPTFANIVIDEQAIPEHAQEQLAIPANRLLDN
jgi:hypothetical protein